MINNGALFIDALSIDLQEDYSRLQITLKMLKSGIWMKDAVTLLSSSMTVGSANTRRMVSATKIGTNKRRYGDMLWSGRFIVFVIL